MDNDKKVIHKVKLFKNPVWIKSKFIGKYNGIKFNMVYREYINEETENTSKAYDFKWPGRIPENKKLAEEGIIALFNNSELDYSSILDNNTDVITDIEEEDLLQEFIDHEADRIDESIQKG